VSQLQSISALSWRTVEHGKIILSFPEEPTIEPEHHMEARNLLISSILNSEEKESPDPPSYFPSRILGYLSFDEDEEGFLYSKQDSTNLDIEAGEKEMDFPYTQNPTLNQRAIFLKQSLHEEQKGSHACA